MTNQQRKEQIYQAIAGKILEHLNAGVMPWRKGWKAQAGGARNAVTKNYYKGVNSYLNLITMFREYNSNEWLTFKQLERKGWQFKKGENGESLAKGQGCPVLFYEQYDKATGATFTLSTVAGMTDEERDEYVKQNVTHILKTFTVFNADLVDGYEQEKLEGDYNADEEQPQAEKVITEWAKIVPIFYGGNESYYHVVKDEIHLPERKRFCTTADFYSVAFHEMAHSTGAKGRLEREQKNEFGSSKYAFEELIAEFTSAFMSAELGISGELSEDIYNSASYIDDWRTAITEKPDFLIESIKQAEIAANYLNNAVAA